MRFEFIALALFAFAGCSASSDIGAECALVKRDVDGGRLFVTNREVGTGAAKDFVSIGSTECDDLICVRDSDWAPPDGGGMDPNETARGYCSRNCLWGDPCPSSSPKLDGNPRTRFLHDPLFGNG